VLVLSFIDTVIRKPRAASTTTLSIDAIKDGMLTVLILDLLVLPVIYSLVLQVQEHGFNVMGKQPGDKPHFEAGLT